MAIDSIRPFQVSVAEAELAKLCRYMNLKRRLNHVQTIVALILVSICLFTIITSAQSVRTDSESQFLNVRHFKAGRPTK